MKKIALLWFLTALVIPTLAQESTPKKTSARPDIPGTFVLELGFNHAYHPPSQFKQGFWGSRTLNVYYQYELRILKSHFSFVPGIGLSLERYKFKDGRILAYRSTATPELRLWAPHTLGYTNGVLKSMLVTNFIEVPLEICYKSRPDDPTRTFRVSVGGRIGYLYDAFTKIKYRDDGQKKKLKDNQNFDLNRIRYGVTARVGVGNISLFGYYNLNSLFKSGKGPANATGTDDNAIILPPINYSTFTIGLSLAAF